MHATIDAYDNGASTASQYVFRAKLHAVPAELEADLRAAGWTREESGNGQTVQWWHTVRVPIEGEDTYTDVDCAHLDAASEQVQAEVRRYTDRVTLLGDLAG